MELKHAGGIHEPLVVRQIDDFLHVVSFGG